jgi:hypothetical protein
MLLVGGIEVRTKETSEEIDESISYAIAGGNKYIILNEKAYDEPSGQSHTFQLRVMIDKIIYW